MLCTGLAEFMIVIKMNFTKAKTDELRRKIVDLTIEIDLCELRINNGIDKHIDWYRKINEYQKEKDKLEKEFSKSIRAENSKKQGTIF